MMKPRVIIADKDLNYIAPLLHRFAEELFDKIELEIISDTDYFHELFSSPQEVAVLILSEELYGESVHRHNIGQIFLMTEQPWSRQDTAQEVNQIYKYTNVQTIFSTIIGKSASVLSVPQIDSSQPKIVLVYSASGGVGKTTIAMGISAFLAENYKRVLYINADRLQRFQWILENKMPIAAPEAYTALARSPGFESVRHCVRHEIFSYLPAFRAGLLSLGLNYSVFRTIADDAKGSGEYDYIVVDADSTFDEEKTAMMQSADKVIIVVDQTIGSVCAANLLYANINGVSADKYIFACNRFDKDRENALVSSTVPPKFLVNEYVPCFPDSAHLKIADLSLNQGIQRIAFLIA